MVFSIIVLGLCFWPKNISFKNFKKYFPIYFLLILLLIEWFLNHPALRYGGFVLVFIIMTFPLAVLLTNQKFTYKKKFFQIKLLLLIIFVVFSARNVNRLINEYNVYNYNLLKNPYYLIDSNFYTMQKAKKYFFKDPSKCKKITLYIKLSVKNFEL